MLASTTDVVATHIITTIIIAEMIQGNINVIDTMTDGLSTIEVAETDSGGTTIETEEATTMAESDRNAMQIISTTTKRIRNG